MPARNDVIYRSAKPGKKPFKLSDGGGLFLLVQPNATKLWRLAYRSSKSFSRSAGTL
jgi:hypothetical protein